MSSTRSRLLALAAAIFALGFGCTRAAEEHQAGLVRVTGTAARKCTTFTAASTVWVAPSDVSVADAFGWGGGGGGSYGANGSTTSGGGGGGAGCAGAPLAFPVLVTPNTSYTILIGSGGSGGVSPSTSPTDGTDTQITLTADGGVQAFWAGGQAGGVAGTAGAGTLAGLGCLSSRLATGGGVSTANNPAGGGTTVPGASFGGTGGNGTAGGANHTAGTTESASIHFSFGPRGGTLVQTQGTFPGAGSSDAGNGGGGGVGGMGGCNWFSTVACAAGGDGGNGQSSNGTSGGNGGGFDASNSGNGGAAGGGGGGVTSGTVGDGGVGGLGDTGFLRLCYVTAT